QVVDVIFYVLERNALKFAQDSGGAAHLGVFLGQDHIGLGADHAVYDLDPVQDAFQVVVAFGLQLHQHVELAGDGADVFDVRKAPQHIDNLGRLLGIAGQQDKGPDLGVGEGRLQFDGVAGDG